ncbi:PLDc N-terminal domain-containing protein [Microbacterium sp. P01]|uniref:PLDc N-terminal domain-containing protein n=1 Tax=unclassified Microbacterium TaxID=2609290 RepID=UPI003672D380
MTHDTTKESLKDIALDAAKAAGAAKAVKAVKAVGPVARIWLFLVGTLQLAFAFLAFWDLAHRPARDIRGPKPVWIPVILVNWIGPLAYFAFGHKR